MNNEKNIALIGCGRIGFLLEKDPLRYKPCTHFGGAQSAGLTINCACDIDEKRLNLFARKANIASTHLYTDFKKMLIEKKPAMVIIATWTESHDTICVEAAKNGASLIILEKPISCDLKRAKRMLNKCRQYNTKIIVNHERRYDSRYKKLKDMISQNIIGDIKTIHASMLTSSYRGPSHIDEGGGPLLHDGTHLVDIISYLFGNIASVQGTFQRDTRTSGFEDRALAWMKTASGIDIFLEAGGSRNYFIRRGCTFRGSGSAHLLGTCCVTVR